MENGVFNGPSTSFYQHRKGSYPFSSYNAVGIGVSNERSFPIKRAGSEVREVWDQLISKLT
jgi:hypothetical protein